MRALLLIWLIAATLLEGVLALLLVGAIVMSPMLFTSEEAFRDPTNWLLIISLFVLMGMLGTVIALQWYFFSVQKRRAAFLLSFLPVLVVVFSGPLEQGVTRVLRWMDGPRVEGIWPDQSSNPQRSFTHESTRSTRFIGDIVRQPNSASSPPNAK